MKVLSSTAKNFPKISQIGEGLQGARVVALLKRPGEMARRDHGIDQMETEKAVAKKFARLRAEPTMPFEQSARLQGDVAIFLEALGGSYAVS